MTVALIVACAFFMENLDATIIVTALPQMAESFHVLPARMSLGVTAYALAVAAGIPASAWIADRYGSRRVFVAAIASFTIASMFCGLAPNFLSFIVGRVLQGGAAALMSPVGRLVVLRNTDKSDLMPALSTLVWPALIAPVLGPPLGGLITSAASWRWIFYVNVPLGLVGMALVLKFVPNERAQERVPFDIKGFVLMALTFACLTYGLDLVGSRQASSLVPGGALVGLSAILGWLGFRHADRAPRPVIDMKIVRLKTFFVGNISGGLISRAAISATPFLLPLMFQIGFGLTPVISGLLLLIYMGANLLMKSIANSILRRFGIRSVLVGNALIAALGIAACAMISPQLPTIVSAIPLVLAGASRSMQFTALTMVGFAEVEDQDRASASVLFSLMQQVGIGMGVAVGAILLNLSQLLRHATSLGIADFRVALLLTGVLSALAMASYRTLAADAGADISGASAGRPPNRS